MDGSYSVLFSLSEPSYLFIIFFFLFYSSPLYSLSIHPSIAIACIIFLVTLIGCARQLFYEKYSMINIHKIFHGMVMGFGLLRLAGFEKKQKKGEGKENEKRRRKILIYTSLPSLSSFPPFFPSLPFPPLLLPSSSLQSSPLPL